jgi:hypothetical protein
MNLRFSGRHKMTNANLLDLYNMITKIMRVFMKISEIKEVHYILEMIFFLVLRKSKHEFNNV